MRKVYLEYFNIKLEDKDKPWAPHYVGKAYVENLKKLTNGMFAVLRFSVKMVWRELKNNFDGSYFCLVDLKQFNHHIKSTRNYPNLKYVQQPVLHYEEAPVSEYSNLPDISIKYDKFHEEVESSEGESGESVFENGSSISEQFKQEKLSDLIRDLNLSKYKTEILVS